MTELLDKAFKEASQLPEKAQEEFAAFLLEELASENTWHTLLSTSAETLDQLARETEREIEAEDTAPLMWETNEVSHNKTLSTDIHSNQLTGIILTKLKNKDIVHYGNQNVRPANRIYTRCAWRETTDSGSAHLRGTNRDLVRLDGKKRG